METGKRGSAMIVRFINIGRQKKTWFTDLNLSGNAEVDKLLIATEARRALVSNDVDAEYEDETHGAIFAGVHCVGVFEIVVES
jgi:hypothetical protein